MIYKFRQVLIEKVVAKQLNNFISQEGISNAHQSAYRSFHSTETTMSKIQNDIAALDMIDRPYMIV